MKLEPLAGPDLPMSVAALAGGATAAKMMAVRGMSPMRAAEFLVAVYQLSFDADAGVKAAAEAAPATLPDKIVLGPLGDPLPPQVLHFFAERLPVSRRQAIEKILFNRTTSDETFVALGKRLDEGGLEIIFQNEVRLLRCPALVEALYFNKHARMSSVSRALELCARNGIKLDGIPAFSDIAEAIMSDPNAAVPTAADEAFAAAMTESSGSAPIAVETGSTGSEEADPPEHKKKVSSSFIKFDELKIFEKIRLATVGNAYCRSVLIRDSNRLVSMSVVRSPAITDGEIVAAAANRAVSDDVIRYIANSREHTKDYAVKQALVNNPKCPLASSLRLLSFLRPDDLKSIARSRNIPGALAAAAKKLLQTREKSGGS